MPAAEADPLTRLLCPYPVRRDDPVLALQFTGSSVSKVAGLFQPNKYVGLREVFGAWKMKQKVRSRLLCKAWS